MSRRTDPADVISTIVFDVVKMIFFGLAILIAWLWEMFRKSPEQQLQKLTPNETWGGTIESVRCPHCGAANEPGTARCFGCGQGLI